MKISYVIQPMSPIIHITIAGISCLHELNMNPINTNTVLIHPNASTHILSRFRYH